ncbi:MAG: hypothetical protein LUG94_01970 [Ruminococcus sp.]|nr:hypothetical protein [Ruminococcus sp.]
MEKIINYFHTQLHNLKKSSPKQFLYAFGLAFISWYIITVNLYPNIYQTISNIPLEIDISNTSAEENELSVITQDVEKVKVQITGERTKIGNLKSEDLMATAVVENVTEAGIYELSIRVTGKDGTSYDVKNIEPSYVTVEFDKYITKEVPIVVNAPDIKAKDGYIMDESSPIITPSTISITGPKTQVDSISELSVNVSESKELDNSYTYHSTNVEDWKIYSESGSEINFDGLTYDLKDIQIDFQVYMTKTLKLKYSVVNAPSSDFVPEFIMSDDEIVVASSASILENLEELSFEIDMREVDANYSETFTIELPTSCRNISNIDTVTISLPSNQYSTREFTNLNNFVFTNIPEGYDIEAVTSGLALELVAPTSIIDEITEDDFVIRVDLSSVQITGNLFNASVTIQLPDYPNAWCLGKHTIVLRATETVDETTTSTDTDTSTDDSQE